MPRAPFAHIQARQERATQANEEAARGQMARPNRAGQGNRRNPLPAPARANHRRQEEEEVQQDWLTKKEPTMMTRNWTKLYS